MANLPRNIQHMYNEGSIPQSKIGWARVDADRTSGAIIVPGRLVVCESGGDTTSADGYENGDGTTASKLVLGLCLGVTDGRKVKKTKHYLAGDEGGGVYYLKATKDEIFAITEDALTNSVTAETGGGNSGTYTILTGTVTPALGVSTETDWTSVFSNDKLDSSEYHATDYVCTAVGLTDDIENVLSTTKVVKFKITAAYRAFA